MNLIKEKSMLELIDWINDNKLYNEDYDYNIKKDSYFSVFDNHKNISELTFVNIDELQNQMLEVLDFNYTTEDLIKISVIAAFKNRPKQEENDGVNSDLEIPGYVYVF